MPTTDDETPTDTENRGERWHENATDTDAPRETPVEAACLFCKCATDPDDRIALETGEYLCSACHGDVREFNRSMHAHLWVSEELAGIRRILLDEWQEGTATLAADDAQTESLPRRRSNADEYQFPE